MRQVHISTINVSSVMIKAKIINYPKPYKNGDEQIKQKQHKVQPKPDKDSEL